MRTSLWAGALALGASLAVSACDPAGADLGFGVEPTGQVAVVAYLDRDGSGTPTALDTLFRGAQVSLRPRGGGVAIATATTDLQGIARFEGVAFGDYLITVNAASIGDSIQVAAIEEAEVRVSATLNEVAVGVRLAYPEVSIRQARLLPAGTRVFARGLVLSGIQVFSDQSAHVSDTSVAVRLTNVSLLGGLTGNTPGDSVVMRGTVGVANGQPILTGVRLTRVATRPAPIPKPVNSGTAATAQGGALDADFVLLTSVVISDTVTVAPNFRVTASDGSGAVRIILDANLGFSLGNFRPARAMSVRGVLIPDGQGGWVLKPRGGGDVTFLN